MSRWDRYVLRPRVRAETSGSETVPHIGPYKRQRLLAAPILKYLYIRDFLSWGHIWAKGSSQGDHQSPRRPLARPSPRTRHQGAWVPGGGPLAPPRFFRKVPTR